MRISLQGVGIFMREFQETISFDENYPDTKDDNNFQSSLWNSDETIQILGCLLWKLEQHVLVDN